ncbi:MFS transporter [Dermabacteraceae bacterium P13136]
MATQKNPNIRRALAANMSDAAGNTVFDDALGILVVVAFGFTTADIGLLNALGSISFLLLSVPAGVLVDRVGPLKTLLGTITAKTLVVGAFFALYAAGQVGVLGTMVAVTLIGMLTVVAENAQVTLVPLLTSDKAMISRTVAKLAAADRVIGVVFPALAGIAISTIGGVATLGLAVALFALTLVLMLRLYLSDKAARDAAVVYTDGEQAPELSDIAPGTVWQEFTHGFKVIAGNRLLIAVVLMNAVGNIGYAIGDSVETVLVLRNLGLSPAFYGMLGTLAALAGMFAAVLSVKVTDRFPTKAIYTVGIFAQTLSAALPLCAYLLPAYGAAFMIAFVVAWTLTLTLTNIAGYTYMAQSVDSGSLGRASAALRMIAMGCVPFAAFGGGYLGTVFGLIVPLVVWPALTLAAAGVFIVLTAGAGGRNRAA